MSDAAGTFVIERTTEERDLGVIITDNLKPTSQCVKAAAKARSVLDVVRRHFNVSILRISSLFTKAISDHTLNTVFRLGHHINKKTSAALRVFSVRQHD